jgi:thiol-activated cytolysin
MAETEILQVPIAMPVVDAPAQAEEEAKSEFLADLHTVDEFVRGIPKIAVGVEADRLVETLEEAREAKGVPGRIARARRELAKVLSDIVVLNPNAGTLYPGNIVQGANISTGQLTPVPLDLRPVTLTLDGLQFKIAKARYSAKVNAPTNGSVKQAIEDILSQAEAATTAALAYSYFRGYSTEQLFVQIGAAYRAATFSAELQAKFRDLYENHVYVVKLVQPYYTVSVEPKPRPSAFFAKGITVTDLTEQGIGLGNPPLYVKNVTYGRMLVFVVRSERSETEIETALRGSFGNFVSSGNWDVTGDIANVINSFDMSVLVLGGEANLTIEAVAKPGQTPSESLGGLLRAGAAYSSDSPGAPISYTLAYLSDNMVAQATVVAPYTQDVWGPYRWTSLWLEGQTYGDDKEPESNVKAMLTKNGKLLAWGESGHIRYYEDKPWSMPLEREFNSSLYGRDIVGSALDMRMQRDDDDWEMDWALWGMLENGSKYRLAASGKTEVNDDKPVSASITSVF